MAFPKYLTGLGEHDKEQLLCDVGGSQPFGQSAGESAFTRNQGMHSVAYSSTLSLDCNTNLDGSGTYERLFW